MERCTNFAIVEEAFQFRKFDGDGAADWSRFSKQPADGVSLRGCRIRQSDAAFKRVAALELPAQPINEPLQFRLAECCL